MAELAQYQQDFISRYAPYANLASQQLGLPSRVILAKIALETGWGQRFANNNLPGLKTGNKDQNDGFGSAQTATWEDYGGSGRTNIKDGFIKYPTPEQSIGGLVPWLTNSTYMNSLADRQGGGILDRDASAEAAAVKALGSSGFSTDRNASAGVTSILEKLPNLSSYGVSPSFSPASVQLMNFVPYNGGTGMANVSEGLGPLLTNDYNTGTEYQAQGQVLPRERGADGLQLPGPQMGTAPASGGGLLDQFSDAITAGLEAAGSGISKGATGVVSAIGDTLTPSAQAAPAEPAPGTTDFSASNVSGGVSNGSFDAAAYLRDRPDVAADPYYGRNPQQHYIDVGQYETWRPFNGGSVSQGVGNGTFNPPLQGPTSQSAPTISAPAATSTIGPGAAFDAAAYLRDRPDVAADPFFGKHPEVHYQMVGQYETWRPFNGATTSPIGPQQTAPTIGAQSAPTLAAPAATPTVAAPGAFDAAAYLRDRPDVAADPFFGKNPEAHYQMVGKYETWRPFNGATAATIPPQSAPTIQAPAASQGLSIMASPTIQPGSTAQTINDIYQAELGRPAEQAAIDYGNALLSSGKVTAADFAAQVRNSPEAQARRSAFPSQDAATIPAPGASPTFENLGLAPTIGAPPTSPTIGPNFAPTINPVLAPTIQAPNAINAYQGISPYDFSGANVSGALGAGPQTFGDYYGTGAGSTQNLGLDLPAANSNPIGDFSFSGANVGGFDVNAAPSQQGGGGGPVAGFGFDPQASEKAFLNGQAMQIIQQDMAGKGIGNGQNALIASGSITNDAQQNDMVSRANSNSLQAFLQNAGRPTAAAPVVNAPRVAQGGFAPAPFFGRW